MKLRVENYSFGSLTVNGKKFNRDILIHNGRVISWRRKDGHLLQVEDLKEVWETPPDKLIIGTGANAMMKIADTVLKECRKKSIEFTALDTAAAVKVFSSRTDEIKISAGFHLSC